MVEQSPSQFTHLLLGHRLRYGNVFVTVVVGAPGKEDTEALLGVIDGVYAPGNMVVYLSSDDEHEQLLQAIPVARDHALLNAGAVAYVCDREMCALPTSDPEELRELLLG